MQKVEYTEASGLGLIQKALEKSVAEIEPQLRAQLKKKYREEIDHLFETFMRLASENDGHIRETLKNNRGLLRDFYSWLKIDDPVHSSRGLYTWAEVRQNADRLSKFYAGADKRADDAFENARESFITKNLYKFKTVLGHRTDVKTIEGNFAYRGGVFEGTIVVTLTDATIYAYVSLKYVFRTIPNITPYYQYPLIFGAKIGGKVYNSISEDELRALLGGGTKEEYAAKAEAEKVAAGVCPGSGQFVPDAVWAKISRMYMKTAACPVCGQHLGVPHGKFRQHLGKEAVKREAASKLTASGYCEMSKQKVPAEIIASLGPVEGYKDPKIPCPACKQLVRCDARKDWIRDQFLDPDGRSTKMKVESAKYFNHKLP
jgi:hypothetical protein